MMNRRKFIKNSSFVITAGLILPANLMAMSRKKIIGIQLYSLRDQIKDDFLGTLDRISEIGFNAVEAAGYYDGKFYGYAPAEYKKIMEDKGMIPQSSHSMVTLDNTDKIIEDTKEAGMSYLVVPYLDKDRRETLDDYKKVAGEFNRIGEKCNNAELRFGYHNHAFEFEKIEEAIPYDILLEETEADLVTMQLDTYWIIYGGYNPIDYFKKYPGRFGLWHVKDMTGGMDRKFTEIGSGTINFNEIFSYKEKAGMEYFYLEQDSFDIPPLESIEISYNYLSNLNF